MSVSMRLARGGSKKRPYYKIIVANSRSSRDGKYLEQIGTYNPLLAKDDENRIKLIEDRARYWLGVGAQPTDRVARFLDAKGIQERTATNNPQKAEPGKKAKDRAEDRATKANDAAEAAAAAAAAPAPEPEPEVEAAPEVEVAPEAEAAPEVANSDAPADAPAEAPTEEAAPEVATEDAPTDAPAEAPTEEVAAEAPTPEANEATPDSDAGDTAADVAGESSQKPAEG